MADCIFCMLANHDIPTNVVYEDDKIFCFHDMEPQAPVHVLLIPKKRIPKRNMSKSIPMKVIWKRNIL